MIAQAIKRYSKRRVIGVLRRVVTGVGAAVTARLRATQGGSESPVINTAYIERLQATFRSRLAALARRSRAGEAEGDTGGGDVAGGHLLQLLLGAQKYAPRARDKRPARWEVGGEHSRPGGRTHGSSLVGRRVVELLCATGGETQVAWETPEMADGGSACGLTTVQWSTASWIHRGFIARCYLVSSSCSAEGPLEGPLLFRPSLVPH
jgi:hypothetical protein